MIGLAVALHFLGNEAVYEVSDHLEARPRVTQNAPGVVATTGNVGLDLLMTPRIYYEIGSPKTEVWSRALPGVAVGAHRWIYTIAYTPSFMLEDALDPGRSILVNNAAVGTAEWRGRATHFALKEQGAYGLQNTAYIGLTTPTPGAPSQLPSVPPALSTLTTALSRSTAIAEYRFSALVLGSVLGEYLVTGGANPGSRETIPLQYGPRAEATINVGQSRRSFWLSTVDVQRIDVQSALCAYLVTGGTGIPSCAPQSEFALVKETWRYFWTHHAFSELGAGVSGLEGRVRSNGVVVDGTLEPADPNQPYKFSAFPAGYFSFTYGSPVQMRYPGYTGDGQSLRIDASVAPFVDYRGVAQNLAGASLTYGLSHQHFIFSEQVAGGAATGSLFIPPERTVSTRSQVVYTINRHVAVDTTLVYSWVNQAPFGPISSGYISIGLTVGTGLVRY